MLMSKIYNCKIDFMLYVLFLRLSFWHFGYTFAQRRIFLNESQKQK